MSKKDFKKYIDTEKELYLLNNSIFEKMKGCLLQTEDYLLYRYVLYMRKAEYFHNRNCKLRFLFFQRKKNILGRKLNISIRKNNFEEGLRIWHGGIIVNGFAKIGKNCQLHGDNCIGNKGNKGIEAPIIGNNVDVGIGAKIIGDVYIADDVKIGANAVVTKSCYEKGAVLVGAPARRIK